MRNAGPSVDPPTDPFEAVAPPVPIKHPTRPVNGSLPPGVSPDIFGPDGPPRPNMPRGARPGSVLPPPAVPVQPWPVKERSRREPLAERPVPEPPPPEDPGRRRRRLIIGLSVVGALLALGYLVPAVGMAGKVMPGVKVAGVEIGGLGPREATDKLRRRLETTATAEMVLRSNLPQMPRLALAPADAGLTFDAERTVEGALIGFPSPLTVWRALTSEQEVPPRISVDREKLNRRIALIAKEIDLKVREGAVVFRGLTPVAVTPRNGRTLDQQATAASVERAYRGFEPAADLVISIERPKVRPEAVTEALADARRAVSAPITLTLDSRSTELSPQVIAANLRFVSDGEGGLRPRFNAKKVVADVQRRLVDAARAPREPTFEIVNGKPKLVPGRPGLGVDADKLAAAVAEVIEKGGSRTVEVSLTKVSPRLSDEEAARLGIKEKISEFTTYFPCCQPRVTNIRTIAAMLDGYLVKPGETFSLNGIVGKRDTARGFVPAPMIMNGRLVDDVGGGISQFVTTMFNAVFFGGLQTVQHTPHEFYISRYPPGRESTVSYPEPDFRWRNDSEYGVLVKTATTATSVTVSFWSTKRYDIESRSSGRYNIQPYKTITETGPDCIPMEGAEGFSIDVWRIFKKNGKEIRREKFHTVYAPEPKLICKKKE